MSDNFQKFQLLFFEIFSVRPAMNLRYAFVFSASNTKYHSLCTLCANPTYYMMSALPKLCLLLFHSHADFGHKSLRGRVQILSRGRERCSFASEKKKPTPMILEYSSLTSPTSCSPVPQIKTIRIWGPQVCGFAPPSRVYELGFSVCSSRVQLPQGARGGLEIDFLLFVGAYVEEGIFLQKFDRKRWHSCWCVGNHVVENPQLPPA